MAPRTLTVLDLPSTPPPLALAQLPPVRRHQRWERARTGQIDVRLLTYLLGRCRKGRS